MTTFDIAVAVLLLVMLAVTVEQRFRVTAILREVRAEGRDTRFALSASVATLTEMERGQLQAQREEAQGRPQAAVETLIQAEALAKQHRHVWRFSSSEKTNGEDVVFYTCAVGWCADVLRVGPDEPTPTDRDVD